jgi:hypothetical protein
MGQLSETLAVITENIKVFSKAFTGRKIFFSAITLIILISVSLLAFDYFTGYLYFNRIERKINILGKIENKSDENRFKEKVKESYYQILDETTLYNTRKSIVIDKKSKSYEIIIKVLISLVLPIILLFTTLGNPDFKNTFIGVLIFIFIFSFISAIIPIIYKMWLTCLIIVFIEIIALTILTKIFNK